MAFSSNWSVRTFLIWLVFVCLFPGVIGATALLIYDYETGRAELKKDTEQTARALMQVVDSNLLKAQAIVQTLAFSNALERGDLAAFHHVARRTIANAQFGSAIVLIDERGQELVNSAVKFGTPLPKSGNIEINKIFTTGKPHFSDIFFAPVLKHQIVSISVPVYINGKITYALSIGILLEQFSAILKTQNLPPDWRVAIFDSSTTIAGRTHSPEKFVGKKGAPQLIRALDRSFEGAIEATTVDGVPVLSVFSRSPVTHWTVAIGIPQQSIASGLMRTLSILAAGVIALFLIGLLFAWRMGEKIAYSVNSLRAPALALGNGELVQLPEVQVKEASEVAQAIGRASNLLHERNMALQEREKELMETYRLAKFGTWHWNLITGEVKTSDSIREIYGRDIPPFPEQKGTLLPLESWNKVRNAAAIAQKDGEGYDLELQVNHGAGHTIWINAKCQADKNDKNQVVALRGTIQDITERKNTDEKLRESEERFRLLADNIAQFAWMADGSGWIFWYNKRWFDYTGTTLDEMQGWGWQTVHHPDHLERVITKFRHCLETGEPWEDTFPLKGVDGKYRWFLSRATPERDASGRVVRWFGTNTDVNEQWEMGEELRKFKFFSDHANDEHLLLDQSGRIRYANRLACETLGYSEEELLNLTLSDINPAYPVEQITNLFTRCKQSRVPPFEGRHKRKDGTTFPVEIAATVLEFKGEWLMFTASRDISERKLAEQQVREAALHDPLTGLPNRALIFEYCSHLMATATRSHGLGALLFIDLDRFKPINDLYGHEIGDRVLQEVARRLVECTRQEDLAGRLGGDEFVVILPRLDVNRHRVVVVAENIISSLNKPFHIDHWELSLSASIGISYFPEHAGNVGALIHTADLAMYQAKQSGRASYQFYVPEFDRRGEDSLLIEMKLKNALKQGELTLHYQPVIDIRTGKLIAAEALVRLKDSDGRLIGPSSFIPIAESAGLIGEVGEWVAIEVCNQLKTWLHQGLHVIVAINVSPIQFRQRAFAERLCSIILSSGVNPSHLEIELTESAVMQSIDDAIEIIKDIKSLGVRVALDDFGTGYSSLASLSSLPIDKLKIDQSFVHKIERDKASRAVTQAIIALGRSLRLDVVGEGIESEVTLRYLKENGCSLAQGFWFSQPLPASEFMEWFQQHQDGYFASAV